MWPGITPMNVWDMSYNMWVVFARAVDAHIEEQSKSQT